MRINEYSLDNVMSFGHMIKVNADGTATDDLCSLGKRPEWALHASETINVSLDSRGQASVAAEKEGLREWEALGWSNFTHSYSGQVGGSRFMHPSEYIGGVLARDMLAQEGYYLAVTVDGYKPDHDDDEEWPEVYAWAVMFHESDD
jgi:hypothetical protein